MKKLIIALIVSIASPAVARAAYYFSAASVLTQRNFEVRVRTSAGEVKVIIQAPNAEQARALAEAQYGRDRIKSVARKW